MPARVLNALAGGCRVSMPGALEGHDRFSGEPTQRAGLQPVAEGDDGFFSASCGPAPASGLSGRLTHEGWALGRSSDCSAATRRCTTCMGSPQANRPHAVGCRKPKLRARRRPLGNTFCSTSRRKLAPPSVRTPILPVLASRYLKLTLPSLQRRMSPCWITPRQLRAGAALDCKSREEHCDD